MTAVLSVRGKRRVGHNDFSNLPSMRFLYINSLTATCNQSIYTGKAEVRVLSAASTVKTMLFHLLTFGLASVMSTATTGDQIEKKPLTEMPF